MDLASAGVLVTLCAGLVAAWVALRKSGPETESLEVSTMHMANQELREVLRSRTERFERDLAVRDAEIAALKARVVAVESRLEEQ